jgi:uncharacterized protein (DUF305 family)
VQFPKSFASSDVETPNHFARPLDFARGERRWVAVVGAVVLLAACSAPTEQAAEADKAEPVAKLNPAQTAYTAANAKMHAGMGAAIDPDADVAFMQGMIPHHQGAVDMAEIVLKHGKDPETRALAEAVIKTQTAEIAQMQAWLAKRGVKPAAAPDTPVASDAADHSKMGH